MVFRCPEIDSLNTTYVLVPVLLYIIRNISSRIYVLHCLCTLNHELLSSFASQEDFEMG